MSWDFFKFTEPKANKEYPCDSWSWLSNCDDIDFSELTFSERKAIAKAKRNGFKIKPGEMYRKVEGKWDGEFTTFRAIIALDDICHKYDIYDE
jgi:hypothetical protein